MPSLRSDDAGVDAELDKLLAERVEEFLTNEHWFDHDIERDLLSLVMRAFDLGRDAGMRRLADELGGREYVPKNCAFAIEWPDDHTILDVHVKGLI